MLPVGIGDAIRARRERTGLTQESLGALLGVQPDLVDEWEWGEAAPEPAQAHGLAVILGLPEGALFPEGPPDGEGEAVVIHLERSGPPAAPAAAPVARAPTAGLLPPRPNRPAPVPAPSGPALVPPRPSQPPPLPAPSRSGPPLVSMQPGGPSDRPAPASARRSRSWLGRVVGGVAIVLLVATAASSGPAAYRQGQLAARYEAEARALRTTLVPLAGERDRLAARLADLSEMLADVGLQIEGEQVSTSP